MPDVAIPRMRTERIKALADGVLAIVLTILVLGFEVPDHDFGKHGLARFLEKLLEPLIAYVVTFGIVSAYWIQHASILHYVTVGSRLFFWANLLFLLPVTLLPFLTNLRAVYHDEHLVTVLYASVNVVSGLLLLLIWRLGNNPAFVRGIRPEVDRSMKRRILLGIALNLVGAAAARIDTHLSSLIFIAVPMLYLSHRTVDANWSEPEA